MATYKTPDVYVEEVSVIPPSVAEVETAIPAFIGYTQKAKRNAADDLVLKPTKIYSMKEFEQYFGYPQVQDISLSVAGEEAEEFKVASFDEPDLDYLLYFSLKLFFDNGGGQCYIVSVGTYPPADAADPDDDDGDDGDDGGPAAEYSLEDGLGAVKMEDEPTLIVIPDAVKLSSTDYATLANAVLTQCDLLKDRFAIFDIFDGEDKFEGNALSVNRGYFGNNYLKYGAAYYPFIKTTLNFHLEKDGSNVKVTYGGKQKDLSSWKKDNTGLYNFVKTKLKDHYVVLPPSGAVAGAYAATDRNRGVWKAPANVSLAGVIEPVVKIDNTVQDGLNVDVTSGKSINAIRAFMGKGTLVWGARTLAGNDNEWRYVPVRRFYNMVEESIKKSTYWAVYEPNDANTWVKVRGMIESYLLQKWREGALAGAAPADAFFVRCGLGTTMDRNDILEGRMNVEIGMAVVRPAEFIILKFSHKLQTS